MANIFVAYSPTALLDLAVATAVAFPFMLFYTLRAVLQESYVEGEFDPMHGEAPRRLRRWEISLFPAHRECSISLSCDYCFSSRIVSGIACVLGTFLGTLRFWSLRWPFRSCYFRMRSVFSSFEFVKNIIW